MAVDVSKTVSALDALMDRMRAETAAAVMEGALTVEALAKGNAPAQTGTLRRSIYTSGPFPLGDATYRASVGPSVIYARIRELGGFIPGGAVPRPKPPGRTGWLHWENASGSHFAKLVHQTGRPYMKPAVETARPLFQDICARHWTAAIKA